MEKLKVGIIGCGVISDVYLKNLTTRYSSLEVTACADRHPEKSRQRAAEYNLKCLEPEELLSDPGIDVILNLTTPLSHAEVSLAAIENGKHVYSEKPLAVTLPEGQKILDAAKAKNLRVGCAPDTFLGASQQTVIKAVADGWIGRPLSASAFFSCPGHERWHINPDFYYQEGGGPVLDNAPYFLTALVAALGPVKKVNAMGGRGFDTRTIGAGPRKGRSIPVNVDTHVSATLETQSGVLITTLWSFDIWGTRLPFVEIYGSAGTLSLPAPSGFDGKVLFRGMESQEFVEFPLCYAHSGNQRGLGLAQMCQKIINGGEHSASGTMALHVLEVMCAIGDSVKSGETTRCNTSFSPPPVLTPGVPESGFGF
jgi:predicted dehydrogenase